MRDMTKGSIPAHMLHFTLPMLIGNIFQQLYIAADTVIVGRLLGKDALAAVGSAGAIMNVLLFLVIGVCLGASILIAQFYGAQDTVSLRREVGTAFTAGILFTLALSGLALLLSRQFLALIRTPEEILDLSARFLKIMIAGLIFSFLFNYLSAAMRALGYVRAPIVILCISSVVNVGLAVLFIRFLGMGVGGAAWATVCSQLLSALLCFVLIQRRIPLLALSRESLRMDLPLLRRTVSYSGVYAVQQSCLYIGVLLLQGAVNSLGINAIAAYNAVTKVDGFALLPGDSLSSSLSTFVAQNQGAGEKKRIVTGVKYAVVMGLVYCGLLAAVMVLAAPRMVSLFVGAEAAEVVSIGGGYLKIMAMMYVFSALCNSFQGFFRGVGRMKVTLAATTIQIPIRVALTYLLLDRLELNAIPVATGIGWVVMMTFEYVLYRAYRKEPPDTRQGYDCDNV